MKNDDRGCEIGGCQEPALVGVNGQWVCLEHFKQGLDVIQKSVLDEMRELQASIDGLNYLKKRREDEQG